ncbi:MAG: hypothetical protein AAB789_00075 [Patescibacteria group bacterium]
MYKTIKKFLAEGGKCLLIENGESIGVVLTVEEYELLQSKSQTNSLASRDLAPPDKSQTEKQSFIAKPVEAENVAPNPIGEAIAKEMDFPQASAEIADIEAVDDITLGDLGIDELPY